ncbi:innexin unc-9-like isoform X3 [Brachionus plicatilis]|uniref:Innexin n=1 Tax=Brachionus plicatilis TaxID=10195 RepID=A0A3M7R186_BRAPC|nr:innexin unc-9-like isoform X3 [Brachionus plicatilis]
MDLFTTVARLPYSILGHHRNDTVIADRLNYKYTVILFVIFSIVVSNKQFGSEQIVCWSPGHFVQNYVNYVNQVCWVSNTFYASMDEHLTKDQPDRKSRVLKYYQWVPFILLFQAFLFYTPRLVWRALSTKSGLNIANLVQAARSYQSSEKFQDRDKIMLYMIKSLDQYSYTRRKRKGGISKKCDCDLQQLCFTDATCCCAGSSSSNMIGSSSGNQGAIGGTYLICLYFLIKLFYLSNSLGQLFLLNVLLGHKNFHLYGIEIMQNIMQGRDASDSVYFPRVTMCDFKVRDVAQVHTYTVQCVLPINLFNEKVFMFVWFWLAFVSFVNFYDLIAWVMRCFFSNVRYQYVKYRIELMQQESHLRKFICKDFVFRYLQQDGCLVLRLVAMNSSDLVASELINELWRKYTEKYRTGSSGIGGVGSRDGQASGHLQSGGSSTIIRSNRQLRGGGGRDQSPGKDPTEL